MLIFPRPSKYCGFCKMEKICPCECHNKDLANGQHYLIRIEAQEIKVKPVVDLDYFRN